MGKTLLRTSISNCEEFLPDIEVVYVHNTNNLSDNLLEFG